MALLQALLVPKSTVIIISRAQRQSAELLRKVKDQYRALGGDRLRSGGWRPRNLRGEVTTYGDDGSTLCGPLGPNEWSVQDAVLSMELANRSRVISLPGTPDTLVGYTPNLVIIDEAARVPDDLYRAVRPMLSVSHGRLVLLSTPFGKRGFYYDEWCRCEEAKRVGRQPPWHAIRMIAPDCPRIEPEFLAEERQAIGDRWFRQEYLCSFEDTVGAVFSHEHIHRAAVETPAGSWF